MNIHPNVQILERDGKPAFAVLPFEEYLKLIQDETAIPHEVAGLVIKRGMNLAKAWRTYLGLTQIEVARKAKISQAALSQMERSENKLRTATLKKLARALGLSEEQLRD